jgi:hypothetical protein
VRASRMGIIEPADALVNRRAADGTALAKPSRTAASKA